MFGGSIIPSWHFGEILYQKLEGRLWIDIEHISNIDNKYNLNISSIINMEQGKTIEDRLDEDESARGFSCIGKFLERDIKGAIGDVSAEEGGRFETVGAFEKDGTTPKAGWLKLYHCPKYS